MKLSLNWLKEYIHIEEDPETLCEILTQTGLEVEGLEERQSIPGGLKGLVIGEVVEKKAHPDADKLSLCKVDVGGDELSPIVCGAPNVAQGQKVVVAMPGCTIFPNEGEPFTIKKAKIRGEVSLGMICAEDEIGLGKSHEGIMVLDTELPNGTPAADLFKPETDYLIEIGLTPNRGDAASHFGSARDLFAVTGRALCKPALQDLPRAADENSKEIKIEDTVGCPRYVGRSLANAEVGESPDWLKKRLLSIGLKPKNNAVDITNYMLHGFGQPMHVFDADQMAGDKLIVRRAKKGEKLITLDEVERELHPEDLVIADNEKPIALAGVMGGLHSAVTEKTKRIYLESAYFHPDVVRATSTRHGIKSDASFRYERGTDPSICVWASEYAAGLLMDVCGVEAASATVDAYPNVQELKTIPISYTYINGLLGKDLSQEETATILERLDIQCTEKSDEGFTALVPAYRWDVTRKADIVEEVLRIYGFNNIEIDGGIAVPWVSPARHSPEESLKNVFRQRLAGAGFKEMMTNSLTSPHYAEAVEGFDTAQHVEMQNHSSVDLSVMRQSLIFTGMESVARNQNHKQADLRLFEFGKSYHKTESGFAEKTELVLYMVGKDLALNWQTQPKALVFHDLKAHLELLLQDLRAQKIRLKEEADPAFAYGLSYQQKGKTVAQVGMLHPKYTKLWDASGEVFIALLDWENLASKYDKTTLYEAIPKFPAVRRDLSVVLDKAKTFQEVEKICKQAGQPLLQEMTVFDVYEGEHLPNGKKSYSVAFTLQDPNKTLKDKQIDKTMEKMIQALEKQLGAEIRR